MNVTYTPQIAETRQHIGEKYRIHVSVNRLPNHSRWSNVHLYAACSARLAGTAEKYRVDVREQGTTSGHALPRRILLSSSAVTFDPGSLISQLPCFYVEKRGEMQTHEYADTERTLGSFHHPGVPVKVFHTVSNVSERTL